ncbi:hypothetical protein [Thermasporomyces composti]|jgi:hypothetical protein|uniref:Uncharacterized protein n=1 Tax=Thermasporomyces composti TaxID=696763 RepID=A0A3D9V8P8_THECX|nr:hypothetical protein [Thermasporomyces composti]REF38142.1 hypothetical protein DFJ64_3613 [Thermasporomyces composti]
MDFATWTRSLSDRGLDVVPPSHPVPVRLSILPPDGGLLEFRCRGTRVTLERYAEADVLLVVPEAWCACGCGRHLPAPMTPPRVAVRPGARPIATAVYDGAVERGWSGYEAGLLRVEEAAVLLDALLPALTATQPEGTTVRAAPSSAAPRAPLPSP